MLSRLKKSYSQVLSRIGDALEDSTLIGPLHSKLSLQKYETTIESIKKQGGKIEFGGKVIILIPTKKKILINIILETQQRRLLC